MIHIHCDRCGKDIDPEGNIGKMSWGFRKGIEAPISSDLLYGRVFCEQCMDLTMAFISGRVEPARGQIKANKKAGRKRLECGIEIKKMKADGLRTDQIAHRLGITQKQVQNYLYHHKEE